MLNGNTMGAGFVVVAQASGTSIQPAGDVAVVLAALVIVANFAWMVIKAMKEQKSNNGRNGLLITCQKHGERLAALEARLNHLADNVEKLYNKLERTE